MKNIQKNVTFKSMFEFITVLSLISVIKAQCPENYTVNFMLETGYVYSSPNDLIESQPGTLMLTECIDMCRNSTQCQSANYETGLCVLFNSSAKENPEFLTTSQYPLFTLYVQKICLKDIYSCEKSWAFERVMGYHLSGFVRKQGIVKSKEICMEVCLKETEFLCRSANFDNVTGECSISDIDRHTMGTTKSLKKQDNIEFLENNCINEPIKLCDFQKISGKIIKTVDSVVQNVDSIDECRNICLKASYRCHSFDYNDTGENVCRFSHHSIATLNEIQDPYLEIPESSTYELGTCYNVTIDCRATEILVRVMTGKLFNGKIYAKGSPSGCMLDVSNSLQFELSMPYQNKECNIKTEPDGQFINEIVIQHHDHILTSADLGLMVKCQYQLYNTTVSNGLGIQVSSNIETLSEEKAIISSPHVIMRISDRQGGEIASAQVGDPLTLKFEIKDKDTPYEIFVRNLVAVDGIDNAEIQLIDEYGCPNDASILGPIRKINTDSKELETHFDAFKFPTSDTVSFRALVTPCFPKCHEAKCEIHDYLGFSRNDISLGRKRRSIYKNRNPEDLLLVQSIHITDKFNFMNEKHTNEHNFYHHFDNENISRRTELIPENTFCFSSVNIFIIGSLFILIQFIIIGICFCLWIKRKNNFENSQIKDSLSQIFYSGYHRR